MTAGLSRFLLAATCSCGGLPQDPERSFPDPPASPASVPLVIEDVRLLSMETEAVVPGRTVVVEQGRITAIGDGATGRPAGALVIQGGGRYLVPGLIDMHVHINQSELSAYLAAGVTSVRNMWGWPALAAIMERVEQGDLAGPRIFSASQGLDDQPVQWPATIVVSSPAAAAAAVRAQRDAGWRWLKVYTRLSRETWLAIMAEARASGIRALGHVPFAVGIDDALAEGQHTIEHLTGYDRAVSRSGRAGTWAWLDADPSRYPALAARTADAGTWNCPTLTIFAELSRRQHSDAEEAVIVRERRRFVRELHAAGARVLAGTDAGIDVVAPGTSLHDELAELVASGLTRYQALRAATVDAGQFLEEPGLGTVTVGAPADLLLVQGNPLEDLARLRQFSGMVHRGAWLPR
jgi:imidazolonepropionase-like amidohydrolase